MIGYLERSLEKMVARILLYGIEGRIMDEWMQNWVNVRIDGN